MECIDGLNKQEVRCLYVKVVHDYRKGRHCVQMQYSERIRCSARQQFI
jgi:hypothetical protein